jgi:hypothetical protein
VTVCGRLADFLRTDPNPTGRPQPAFAPLARAYSHRANDEFDAIEGGKIASGFMEAARIIDGAALPAGKGTTFAVEQVALLAGVDGFDVREAIVRGELSAHKTVDGTSRLLVEWGEGTTWANAQRTFDERSDRA